MIDRVRTWQHPAGRERVTMTAAQPGRPVPEGARGLKVRWIFPGELETAVAEWLFTLPG